MTAKVPVNCSSTVTIVVLTHNRRKELSRCLEHLLALAERPSIVVVNNGSTDDTRAFLRTHHSGIAVIDAGTNLGAAGRNLGVEAVSTPFVAFSDDDTWWAPGALPLAVQLFQHHPEIAVMSAQVLVGAQQRQDPACAVMENSPLGVVPEIGPRLTGFMAGASIMRVRAFREAGGYWPPFFIGGEEALLAMDLLDAGWQIVYAPALRVHHWPSAQRNAAQRQHLIARNAIWTALLRLPWPTAWQRSRIALASVPAGTLRRRVLRETLLRLGTLLSARRRLHDATCKQLATVWRHEQGGANHSRQVC